MEVKSLGSIVVTFKEKAEDELSLAIKRHIKAHQNVTLIDIVKFLYQSLLGSFHLLDHMSESEIEAWITKDLASAKPARRPVTERLYGNRWARLDLGAFKRMYGPKNKLLTSLFLKGKDEERSSISEFSTCLDAMLKLISNGKIKPSSSTENLLDLTLDFLSEYKRMDFPPLHHSRLYSERNHQYIVMPHNSLTSLVRFKVSG